PYPIDRVAVLAYGEADRITRLEQLLGRRQIGVPRPAVDERLIARTVGTREDLLQVNTGMLLVEVEPRTARLHLTAGDRRHGHPLAMIGGEIFAVLGDRAVLLHQRIDDVVHRLKDGTVHLNLP